MPNDPLHPEEPRLATILRALDANLPPPDAAALAALRERSAEAFAEAGGSNEEVSPLPRRSMFPYVVRLSALVLASAVAIAVMLSPWSENSATAVPFSQVLGALREATTLHLKLVKPDGPAEIWIRRPGLVRRETSPQHYEIAAGSRLWRVDEETNTVTTGDSPWFRSPDQQIDLIALLGVGIKDSSPLLSSKSSGHIEYAGRKCLVYRVNVPSSDGKIEIEALADAATLELAAIIARPAGAAREAGPPLAELQLVAVNAPADDDKFVVAKTLTEDGRIGTIAEAQGVAVVRPMLAKRWTPICRDLLIKPGDWLRTELRGANALKVKLSSEVEITLGPGSLLECISPTEARLHNGIAQINVTKKDATLLLLGPQKESRKFTDGKQLVRVDREEKIVDVPQQPAWLAGFEGSSNNESLGSLIVNLPDGRNTPLTVGYHKVKVEIRDQIARTTIEESFVNRTDLRLEGTFHFPLPQDASISGFGMWIGNDLVEADIVEKQRAREIYETILREKRDPGLLEWTGGNLFKARVFPIEPRSEKRIKIVYTQVLPLRHGKYHYTYGLRSEMLQTTPLRDLSLQVTVNSALPLKSIACPTHATRIQQTEHSGQVEFAAQEYTPTRDFEVVCEVNPGQSDVVLIPHRRGSDGYFLLQITPPSDEGKLQRELLADGKGLNITLLCDTSASMDQVKRKEQAEFVSTILNSLGEGDKFQLGAADVGTVWAFKESVAATPDNRAAALAFLDARLSLGWTNLDLAFAEAVKKSPEGGQIVYIGDGLISAGDTDPAAFVKRLTQSLMGDKHTLHAITVGNTSESVVMRGIARAGGGSTRSISGEQTAQIVATELLRELTQPGLRELNIEFRGLKVAAVYPEVLPNVAEGTQQIVVGRYLPEGADQQGEVIVTGMRGGEKVRYAAKVKLKDAEEGNSFIPRLWARGHLDHLLAQGTSSAVRDNIIALSEEFHIITPYTSLLVLESDADRERFGVQRRYEMRDGERFFLAGRENANFELLQQQMKRAGDWRIDLRRQVLRDLAMLGRNPHMFEARRSRFGRYDTYSELSGKYSESLAQVDRMQSLSDLSTVGLDFAGEKDEKGALNGPWGGIDQDEEKLLLSDGGESDARKKELKDAEETGYFDVDKQQDGLVPEESLELGDPLPALQAPLEKAKAYDAMPFGARGGALSLRSSLLGRPMGYGQQVDYTAWLNTLFPALSAPAAKAEPGKDPADWPAAAIALSKSLSRAEALRKMEGGIALRRTWDTFDPRWKRRSSHNTELTLYAPTAWLKRTLDLDDHTLVEYCDAKERGTYSLALLLGRTRASVPFELDPTTVISLQDYSLAPLHEGYRTYRARVEDAGAGQQRLITFQSDSDYETHFIIDTEKHVVVKIETHQEGKVSATTTFADFVEVAGTWWAKTSTTTNADGETIAAITYDIQSLAKDKYAERMTAELAAKAKVQFLHLPLVKFKVAQQKVADGSSNFDDLMTMILFDVWKQQWDDLEKHLAAAEKLAADKPGMRWLRTLLLETMRRNEEARERLLGEARELAKGKQQDELWLADFILSRAYQVTSPAERLEFVELLKPVYERQPAELEGMVKWQSHLLGCYQNLNRSEDALAVSKAVAEAQPWNYYAQVEHARRLVNAGQPDTGIAWLRKEIDRPIKRERYEEEVLWAALADTYRTQTRWADLLKFTTEWIARQPEYTSAYGQHLSALIYNDKLDQAYKLVEQWLTENRIPGKLPPPAYARLESAISFAQGNGYGISFYRMDQRWIEPLAETAKYFATHKHHFEITRRICGYGVMEHDAGDRLRGYFLSLLTNDLDQLTSEQIVFFVSTSLSGRLVPVAPINGKKQLDADEVPNEVWQAIAGRLRERWTTATNKDDKHRLSEALVNIYSKRFREAKYLAFLRERIASAPEQYKSTYINGLFGVLLSEPWTEAIEQESLALIAQLSQADDANERLIQQVSALYRWTDAMLVNRQAAEERKLADAGGVDKLTRQELAKKKAEFKKSARTAVAERLGAAAEKDKTPLASWLRIEQTWLDVQLDQRLAQVEAECWKILGEAPAKIADDDLEVPTPAQQAQRFFDAVLRQRAFVTVMNLAARRSAKPEAIEHVMKYIDAGIAQGGDSAANWRSAKFRLLVALDRPDDLDKELRAWIRADVSTAPWRMMLAHLLAERGNLDEAIQLFEAAEKDKLLTPADYRILSDWYLVRNRREAQERAKLEAYKQMPEYYLSNAVYRVRDRWLYRHGNQPLPSELDEATLLTFKALFEKSSQPENYLYYLRDVYAACRDFRLLQVLPDSVLGRSPQQIYSFLIGVQNNILGELRNEATADEILARIKQLRTKERTATDLRALDLFEAMIERRSSEVLNQPKPHADACLAALQRAFERQWSEGEPRLMANFHYSLGTLRDPRLVEEQLRELRELRKLAAAKSRDHLQITNDLCNVLFWNYGRKDEAIREMESEVRDYAQANEGQWPHADNEILGSYVRMLEGADRHAAGETVLQSYLAKSQNDDQRRWLRDRLLALYNHALEHDGATSLGSGAALLKGVAAKAYQQIDASADERERYLIVNKLVQIFDTAFRKKIAGNAELVRHFAFEIIPAVLEKQQDNYRNTASEPVRVIDEVLGLKAGMQYLIERVEHYPQRFEIGWNNAWSTFGNQIADHRQKMLEAKQPLGELEPRLLKLVIAELKRDLRTGESRGSYLYHWNNYFWKEKTADFAKAANEVYAEQKNSGRRVLYIADYFWRGLQMHERGVEILLIAYRDGLLDERGQFELVEYMLHDQRYAEAIPILEGLIARKPDHLAYRTRLMICYFKTKRADQLRELQAQTAEHFHKEGRWTAANIAELAKACLQTELNQLSADYFREAISLYQRQRPGASAGDTTLSSWYQDQARAYSALGKTKEAVEAASAAVVCWGAHQNERKDALNTLTSVLAAAKDLDAYVKTLDVETAKTQQDSPILRKAIGEVYQQKGLHDQAIAQYQLALALQPNDKELHKQLMTVYDASGRQQEGTQQLLKLIDLSPHELSLYKDLAKRLAGDEALAERAATSIIESAPGEAESHQAMAEVRQEQNRWDEAIPHWKQVAELRRLEPTGLLGLAAAQIHEKQLDDARATVKKLQQTEWPTRFEQTLREQMPKLEAALPK
jgi:predicted Zn-dependent protease